VLCHILLWLWYSVIFESVASSCADYSRLWGNDIYIKALFTLTWILLLEVTKCLYYWWLICSMANIRHSFWKCNNTTCDLLKKIIFEPYSCGRRVRKTKKQLVNTTTADIEHLVIRHATLIISCTRKVALAKYTKQPCWYMFWWVNDRRCMANDRVLDVPSRKSFNDVVRGFIRQKVGKHYPVVWF